MKINNLLDFFYYTKSERRGTVVLLLFCAGIFMVPQFFSGLPPEVPKLSNQELVITASLKEGKGKYTYSEHRYAKKSYRQFKRFVFDPNTVSQSELLALGVSPKVAAIWGKYRSKGGSFRKPEDVSRIYGISEKLFQELAPYVEIKQNKVNHSFETANSADKPGGWNNEVRPESSTFSKYPSNDRGGWNKNRRPCEPIDINQSDTAAWDRLPGIGKVLAARITKYREKLGGFYRIEQIAETYGLADSVFQKIRPCLQLSDPVIKPILLNQATFAELNAHPYIDFKEAKAILAYRDQHGKFSNVEELKEVRVLAEGGYEKLAPYIKL
jgi:competence ComEA-like helix-hairpin-helix protein